MKVLNVNEISEILPQRYPFLLIDRVLEFEKDKNFTALKNVSINEDFFFGHFPGNPVMPGVLLLEAMGQAGIIFLSLNTGNGKFREFYLSSVKARFFQVVRPGDQVIFNVSPIKLTKNAGIISVIASVNDKKVAKAELAGSRGVENE